MDAARIREDFDAIARLGAESGEDRYDRFLLALVPPAALRLLDVGCGQGRLTRALAARLPGARVQGHWLWRTTLIWDKPAGPAARPASIDAARRDA